MTLLPQPSQLQLGTHRPLESRQGQDVPRGRPQSSQLRDLKGLPGAAFIGGGTLDRWEPIKIYRIFGDYQDI